MTLAFARRPAATPPVAPSASHTRSAFVALRPPAPTMHAMSTSPFISPRLRTPAVLAATAPKACPRLQPARMSTSPAPTTSSSSSPSASNGAAGAAPEDDVPAYTRSPQEVELLHDFIQSGPVYRTAKLSIRPMDEEDPRCFTDSFETCIDDWVHMGAILEKELGSQSNNVRVYHYYLPIYFWLLRELDRFADRLAADDDALPRPFIMGFCCPQGGGKTTMTTFIAKMLNGMGKSVQIASLDDFYVTNAEQNEIARAHADNPLMQYRGMPGTHDVPLLVQTLDDLRYGRKPAIPRYDKSAFEGRGDRAPKEKWARMLSSTDVVLLEGWCLGFEPVDPSKLHNDHLSVVNEALRDFDHIYKRLDGLFLIEISNMEWVFEWRMQAERDSRNAGRPGLTDEQVKDFVSRFMPAYKQYTPQLYERPIPLFPDHELHIEIDQDRKPVHTPRSRFNLG